MTEAVLGLLTALVSLATALVSVWQLRRQRQKESVQPAAAQYYYGQPPGAPTGPHVPHGPHGPGNASYGPAPPTWSPPFGGPAPSSQGPLPQPFGVGAAAAPRRRQPEVWAAVRDASLIFGASMLLGIVLVLAAGELDPNTANVLDIACLLVGFTISAVRARGSRTRHLLVAGLTIWVLSLLNVVLGVVPFLSWFVALPLIAACAAVGGVISLAFKRPRG